MKKTLAMFLVAILILGMGGCSANGKNSEKNASQAIGNTAAEVTEYKAPENVAQPTKPTEFKETTIATTTTTEPIENMYESNQYYEIVESAEFKNSIGDTIKIDKVLAKKDATVSATIIAYDKNDDVLGKSSDEIILTKGAYNYFRYSFESDISDATLDISWSSEEDSFLTGPRECVEMVKYNYSDNYLYITFKQTKDKMGAFAKFKILYYKDGKIIDADDGYFSAYAENLNGKDTKDVASILAYGKEFDSIEYVCEP